MLKHLVIAAVLMFPALANAEFLAKKPAAELKAAVKAPTLTVDWILHKINSSYMQGMQRCYVKGLAQDNSLAGRVTMVFTVNPWGRVSGTVTGIAPKVDMCLTNQLASWRFPGARNGKDKPTVATFKLNLLLRQ